MTWHLVNYADEKFKVEQSFIEEVHSKNFNIISYNRDWLVSTNYYKDNQILLDEKTGGGWWVCVSPATLQAFVQPLRTG